MSLQPTLPRGPGDVHRTGAPTAPRYPSLGALAPAALAGSLVEPPCSLAVSWWLGTAPHVLPGAGRRTYSVPAGGWALDALAGDLEPLLFTTAPKGRGEVLCGATFGGEGPDGADSPEAQGEPRTDRAATTWDVLVLDSDGKPGGLTLDAAAEALAARGLGAVLYPSPSHVGPAGPAVRWRALVHVVGWAPDVGKALDAGQGGGTGALARLMCSLLGPLDSSTQHPGGCCYVHPVVAPRGPGDLRRVPGRALDLGALATWAHVQGFARRRGAPPDTYDLGAIATLLARRGLGPMTGGGVHEAPCPLEHEHGSGGAGSSCAYDPAGGWWRCLHEHSNGRRPGPKGLGALVRAALMHWPEACEGLDLRPLSGVAGEVRARVAAEALEGLRVVDVAAVRDECVEACGAAVLSGAPVLLVAPPGGGKTLGNAAGGAKYAPEAPEGAEDTKAVWSRVVHTRERLADEVDAVRREARAGGRVFLPLIATSVPDVLGADGAPVCIALDRARALAAAGQSARAILCHDAAAVGTPGHRPCERRRDCPGAQLWQPAPGLTPHELGARDRVLVATHAAAGAAVAGLRAGGLLSVDEATREPWTVEALTGEALTAGASLASWQSVRGVPDAGDVVASLARALSRDLEALGLPPGERLGWACAQSYARGAADVRRALEAWTSGDRWPLHSTRPGRSGTVVGWPHGKVPGGVLGAGALRGLRAWLVGATVLPPSNDGEAWSVLVPSAHTEAMRVALEGGSSVVGFDATGDAAVWRWQTGRDDATTEAVSCEASAELSRVVVATGRGAAVSLLKYTDGAVWSPERVRWTGDGAEGVAELLGAVARELAAEAPEGGDGAGVSRGLVSRSLAAWWKLAQGADLAAAVEEACEGAEGARAAVEASVLELRDRADLGPLREALAGWVARWPRWRWTWWGSTLSRGSDVLRDVRALVALGDPYPTPAAVRARCAATGESAESASEALCDAEAVQWFGRARVLRRAPGERVALVYVGRRPPRSWTGPGVRVVTVAPERPRTPPPAAAAARVAPPTGTTAIASTVRDLRASGWTMERLRAELGGVAERTLRRWERGETEPPVEVLQRARELLASTEGDRVRERVAAVLRHRGAAAVWSGRPRRGGAPVGAASLVALLRAAGQPARAGAAVLEALAQGEDSPAVKALRAALVAPLWEGSVLDALERVRPPAPAVPLTRPVEAPAPPVEVPPPAPAPPAPPLALVGPSVARTGPRSAEGGRSLRVKPLRAAALSRSAPVPQGPELPGVDPPAGRGAA